MMVSMRLLKMILLAGVLLLLALYGWVGHVGVAADTIAAEINDTGQSQCYGVNAELVSCIGSGAPPGQDAAWGRDARARVGALGKIGGGMGGFDYTKLDANGNALFIQNRSWSRDASGKDDGYEVFGSKWSCVRDNFTGLVWEVKTNSPISGIRDKNWAYAWYSEQGYSNVQDGCQFAGRCNSKKYIADVNTTNLCGYSNWRMPSISELQSLVNRGKSSPAIDMEYFPNTQVEEYWSATSETTMLWGAWTVNFNSGRSFPTFKGARRHIRLVHGG